MRSNVNNTAFHVSLIYTHKVYFPSSAGRKACKREEEKVPRKWHGKQITARSKSLFYYGYCLAGSHTRARLHHAIRSHRIPFRSPALHLPLAENAGRIPIASLFCSALRFQSFEFARSTGEFTVQSVLCDMCARQQPTPLPRSPPVRKTAPALLFSNFPTQTNAKPTAQTAKCRHFFAPDSAGQNQ